MQVLVLEPVEGQGSDAREWIYRRQELNHRGGPMQSLRLSLMQDLQRQMQVLATPRPRMQVLATPGPRMQVLATPGPRMQVPVS
jgi:hypothetical protein